MPELAASFNVASLFDVVVVADTTEDISWQKELFRLTSVDPFSKSSNLEFGELNSKLSKEIQIL